MSPRLSRWVADELQLESGFVDAVPASEMRAVPPVTVSLLQNQWCSGMVTFPNLHVRASMLLSKTLSWRTYALLDGPWLGKHAFTSRLQLSTLLQYHRIFPKKISTSCTQCAKRRLPGKNRDLSEKKLVGFPNAGKSSLLRVISNAKPAVAAYPFTTLNPHVGIIHYQDHEQVAVADIPGIISGAHQNRGLGFAFLRHIERCRFLLYVLDLSTIQPWTQLQDLKYELEQYKEGLSRRPHAIVGNKMDLPDSQINLPLLRQRVKEKVIPVSALTGQNVEELILHLRELYDSYVAKEEAQMKKPLRW